MAQIIDRVVIAFKRTARRVIRNIRNETNREEEKAEVGNGRAQYELHQRLEGLLQGKESGKYAQEKDQEPPAKAEKTGTSAQQIEDFLANSKRSAASIEGKSRGDARGSAGYGTTRKLTTESEAARRIKVDQPEVEGLRKEVEDIEKAIVEHIEYTVQPESLGKEGTIDKLIEKWNGKERSPSETSEP